MFDEVKKEMMGLSEVVHRFAFDIVFAPLQEQMSHLHEMEVSMHGVYPCILDIFHQDAYFTFPYYANLSFRFGHHRVPGEL